MICTGSTIIKEILKTHNWVEVANSSFLGIFLVVFILIKPFTTYKPVYNTRIFKKLLIRILATSVVVQF